MKVDNLGIKDDIHGKTNNNNNDNNNNTRMKRQTPATNINTILRNLNSASSSPSPSSQSKPIIAKSKFASTKNLKELVIGRCYEYMLKSNQPSSSRWDCGMLWSKLFEAFSYKGPCEATQHDYESLIDLMEEDVPKDKVCLYFRYR